ncbi:ankyrin-1-like [Stylophora pistillata]|nr:ankyrin-1-like [Stylophora pistillata]
MLSSSTGSLTVGMMLPTPCPCGFASLHIAAKHGYHSVAEMLIKYKADPDAFDCNGSTPLHIASCHNKPSLITLLVNSGVDIDARSLNGSTPLHSAASCFSKDIFGHLFDLGCDYRATDDEGMTALHYVVKDIAHVGFEYFADLYVTIPRGWIEKHSGASETIISELDTQYPWLNTFIKLVELVSRKEKAYKITALAMYDHRNRTVFHILEEKTNAFIYLTGSNRLSESFLVLSLTPLIPSFDIVISERVKNRVVALNKPYEQALVATSLKKVISRAYTSTFTKFNCSDLLDYVRRHYVYAANTLLQAGVGVNCRGASGLTPLLVYLRIGGRHMSKVLVKHNVKVDIECGDTFVDSVFHLASYHKLHYLHYLYEYLMGNDNWQKYLQTENALFDYFLDKYDEHVDKRYLKTIRTGDGPLTLAILSHPDGSNVIDECFDAEGYNALHRAAQGANLVAIEKFLSLGANISVKTHDGFSPLWLSVLYAVKYRPFLNLEVPSALTALEVEFASLSALTILNHLQKNGTLDIGCSEKRSDLTLYHVAATRGMWQFITHLLSSSKVIGVDVNCPNKDGITPMYLAMFIGGDSCEWHSPWCIVVDVIKSYGGTLRYPSLEAEYFLIYNIFFGMNPSKLFLELTEDEILTLQEGCGRDECRKYKAANVNLFRTSNEIDRIHVDYQKKVDKCSSFIAECPADIKRGLPHFTIVVYFLDRQQALKFRFLDTRNSLVTFLDAEIERLKKLLFSASRPHAEMPCRKAPKDNKPKEDTIDMCYQFRGKQDLETLLHKYYRIYKGNLDLILEKSDEVKSHMPVNGRLPRFLTKMNFALADYDTSLNCDWQAIAIKYVQLSFQVRNLNYWIQVSHETSTVPSVSGFLSKRMEGAILQHSEESLKLIFKLASGHPTEAFNYLRILRFTRPPMWYETFSDVGNFGQGMGP